MKKLALFLVLVLSLGTFAPVGVGAASIPVEHEFLKEQPAHTKGVDCYELFENTSFEVLDSATAFYFWETSSHLATANSYIGSEVVDRAEDAHTGKYALKLNVDEPDATKHYAHGIGSSKIKAGEMYEFSAWVKKLEECERVVAMIRFEGKYLGVPQTYAMVKLEFADAPVGQWVQKTVQFKAPEYASMVYFTLRLMGKGEMLWDDVSLLHLTTDMPKPPEDIYKAPIEHIFVPNAGFEDGTVGQQPNGTGDGWATIKTHDAKTSDKYAHSGTKSMELRSDNDINDALVETVIRGFKNGAKYQYSVWAYNPEESKVDLALWAHYSALDDYSYDPTTVLGSVKQHFEVRKTEGWNRYILELTPPDDTKCCRIVIRNKGFRGVIFVDDAEVNMVKAPDALSADTDETFYYTEWEKGYLEAVPYTIKDPYHSSVEFAFVDLDGTEIHKETISPVGEGVKYTFRTEWMKEKGKQYQVVMRVYGPDGSLLQDAKYPVYRFDRPTYLGADGIFRKNGKEYNVVMGSGINMERLAKHPEAGGCSIVLLVADANIPILERLDRVYEQGLLAMVNLHGALAEDTLEAQTAQIRDTVSLVKDHPAMFGYKLTDEPFQANMPAEKMMAAYETIRNIDPNHVVYVDDSVPGGYSWLFRYADLVDIDYYGGADPNGGRIISDIMDIGMEASKGRKPFSILLQFFINNGYFPSVDELRHMTYQAFFSGAAGYGYHTLGIDETDGNKTASIDRPEWQEIVEKWAPWERDFLFDCFVTGKYKFVNAQKTEDIMWATFTDGSDIYAIVLNREKSAPKEAVIPLTDGAGNVLADGFTANTMTGEKNRVTGSGTFSISLHPWEAVVWKITPHNAMDTSHLKAIGYRDLMLYPWAQTAIETLEEKGIANNVAPNWYGPGEKITRGDYAMFLVRTLGISVAPGENFADVAADAEYAKELAIGKAAGIINGVGDNKFNPEAQITRQDMMTMTSRAMQLAGVTDLSAFSDNGQIADYAASHVSAMVAEGLIKGNADGTINPLGNTTRAEAAVIMNRILNK